MATDMPAHIEDEIVVTPEMIEAGCSILDLGAARDLVDGFENPADMALAMYRAMRAIELRHLHKK